MLLDGPGTGLAEKLPMSPQGWPMCLWRPEVLKDMQEEMCEVWTASLLPVPTEECCHDLHCGCSNSQVWPGFSENEIYVSYINYM